MKTDILIVGAGITGLSAANYLHKAGKKFLLAEASDRVGGRVKSDKVDGFLLDHGFQVLLTEYPEAKQLLNYEKLKLRKFFPGVYIYNGSPKFKLLADPGRVPRKMFTSFFSGVGSVGDKFKILSLKRKLHHMTMEDIFDQPEMTTFEALKSYGFSNGFIDQFLKPFFSGVFLETELTTSRKMFDFCFKMFSEGFAAVPEGGMGRIPEQLAGNLPEESLLLNSRVVALHGNKATLENGKEISAKTVILALPPTNEIEGVEKQMNVKFRPVNTFYYKFSHSPFDEAYMALNSLPVGLINHLAVMTDVSTKYSFTSDALISVSVVDDHGLQPEILAREVKKELKEWFGPQASYWELIRHYRIKHALPTQDIVHNDLDINTVRLGENLYQVSDCVTNGSINGAMRAGRQIAEHITGKATLKTPGSRLAAEAE